MALSDKILDLRQHREAIRAAIVDGGGVLPLGSHMSDYPGAIEALVGDGEIDFSGVNGLVKELELKDGVVRFKDLGGDTLVLPDEPHKIGGSFLRDNTSITKLVNTEHTTEIGQDAFNNSGIAGDVSFPNVTTLVSTGSYGGYHFYGSKISSINLPQLEHLPYQALSYCRSLKTINIPSVNTISYSAFNSSGVVETITLGETIPVIEGGTSFNSFLGSLYSLNCQLQVPPHMVDDYKADTFWSQYAERIVPYPESDE